MIDIGKMIIVIGIVLVVFGVIISSGIKIPFIGKLPGDILIKRDNFTFYAPIATSILISILLTIILRLFHK